MANLSLLKKIGKMYIKIIIFSICLINFSCAGKKPETDIDHSIQYECSKYENGNIWRLGMTVDSIPQGAFVTFFPDGKIKYFYFYLNGKEIGPTAAFYKNGRMRSYFFSDTEGKLQGECKSFHNNGQRCMESFYINGSIHGLLKLYDRDGNIEAIWEYDMGKFVRTIHGSDPDPDPDDEKETLQDPNPDDEEE